MTDPAAEPRTAAAPDTSWLDQMHPSREADPPKPGEPPALAGLDGERHPFCDELTEWYRRYRLAAQEPQP